MKYPCFLCMWDSRADSQHYIRKEWPERTELVSGARSIKHPPLVDHKKVLLPPLHIKLGLMIAFVGALDTNGEAFKYLADKFSQISDAKKKAGIFIGPQITELIKDREFQSALSSCERTAWEAFTSVVSNFLGNHKSDDHGQVVQALVNSFQELHVGCRMSVKLHFLDSYLQYFPDNLEDYSKEQGKRFHQDISKMERRYLGRWNVAMLVDYYWSLKRQNPAAQHKRQSKKRRFGSNS